LLTAQGERCGENTVLDGQVPKVFSVSDPPAITTTVGAVEDTQEL
jgi:hypothetical protein